MVIGLIVFFRTSFVWYEYLLIGFLADVVSGPVEIGFFSIPLYSFIIMIIGLGAFFIRKRITLHV